MAFLNFSVTSPASNAVVGRSFTATGRARGVGLGLPVYVVEEVRVSVAGGAEQVAQLAAGNWTTLLSVPPQIPGGSPLRITATARGMFTPDVGEPGDPVPGDPEPFETSTTVDIVLDGSVPDILTIDSFATPVTTEPGQPYVLDVTGTAGDAQTGISSVRLKVDNGQFVDVVDIIDNGAGLKLWRQKAVELSPGVHHFTVQAVDGAGNSATAQARIVVRLPFEPGAAEQVFEPTRYLLDLREFARRYVEVAGATGVLTPAMLASRFHQPYDRLVEPTHFEQATRPVPQARISVEVLRGRLGTAAPHEVDQRFRGLAYQTFLRSLGTSYDELRLARTAAAPAREALATRLGIGLVAARPDRLDELTVSPDAITDESLEMLTGYRSTAAGDPLRPTVDGAKVLLWRRDALRVQWQKEDETQRDSAAGPLPLIDPDLIGEGHLRRREPSDPAFALWTARRVWVNGMLAEIEQATGPGPNPLARFDNAVTTFVGEIDLVALAAQDADGVDIRPDLVPWELSLEAFRFLARSRTLLADDILLDSEWDDVVAILLQVQKRKEYRAWRLDERRNSLVLEPATFVDGGIDQLVGVPRWRAQRSEYLGWRRTLAARVAAAAGLESSYQRVVEATEATMLPDLRDALVTLLALPQEPSDAVADRLTRELMIDLRAGAGQRTTRVEQALQTLQGVLFSARAGRLGPDGSGESWTIDDEVSAGHDFDREWDWMGGLRTWRSATRVFAYPENQLLPAVYVADPGLTPAPTEAYSTLIQTLRSEGRLTPSRARRIAEIYLEDLGVTLPTGFVITDELSDADLVQRQAASIAMHVPTIPHREIFWLIPMALAAKLQESGQYQAALDWYRTVYAYHLPAEHRRIYHGLTLEAFIESDYDRVPEWLIAELNPHLFALTRRNCYTRATLMAIAGCFHAFADAEFARGTADANARARTLYETAVELLELPEAQPETGEDVPFPVNPVFEALRRYGRAGLAKIHEGLNIAGVPMSSYESFLPSQYRYNVLVERAKSLVAIAQQVEAAYLAALELRDAKTYDALQAGNHLAVAGASVAIQELKVTHADTGIRLAELQRERAVLQEDHYDRQIELGISGWEWTSLGLMGAAAAFHTASVVAFGAGGIGNTIKSVFTFGLLGDPGDSFGNMLAAAAAAASTGGQIASTLASFERREREWYFQRGLAAKDREIGDQQIQNAYNQQQLAMHERDLSRMQMQHAEAVVVFLATRFTNAELFEWMSGVLGRVYAFFLQQATALAQLAEAQLAFERQEMPAGFVAGDYWRDETAGAAAPDRRGLTGSARLLEDIQRLDQYAFDTDRRKLHLAQTFSLSSVAALELQQFRETGVLTFATPAELFDREFPGHYLRLVSKIGVTMVALVDPVRGIRATLSASGVSRTVVARGPFDTVTLRRQPESIAFTSPNHATGLFDLEPESRLLRPFEGMGVDTVWRLELPKAANPFDFRMIADILLTIEYTAIDSAEYRQQVVRGLDRRFSGDRMFSVRNQFPDAWYELNNPETVAADRRMRVTLPLTADDLPPHIDDLRVEEVSLFALRADALAEELTVTSLSHVIGGQRVTTTEVTTTGGIVGTRRPAGAAWRILLGRGPAGDWELQLPDDELVRSWFRDGLIDDLVLVLTLAGTTPAWP